MGRKQFKPKDEWIEEQKLAQAQRSAENRRGRENPARLPNRLARTSAFAPKSRGLNTDSKFERYYVVPGHSAVRILGRELGTKHRDLLYAVFRLKPEREQKGSRYVYTVKTTWRELLTTTGKTHHRKNALTLLNHLVDFQKVVMQIYQGNPADVLEALNRHELPAAKGFSGNILSDIKWDGERLDDEIHIEYGEWVRTMFEKRHLVSLNAEVQFALKSDYAKSFWPFIDSQPNHNYIDEERLVQLADVEIWEDKTTLDGKVIKAANVRAQFRKDCKQAFDDMVTAGGLLSWTVEEIGQGRRKSRRYSYVHALPRQLEMSLIEEACEEGFDDEKN